MSEPAHDCSRAQALTPGREVEPMPRATNSLPQSTLDTFQPVSASAVHVLARMAARRAVTEELRAAGVRVTLVKPAEISAKAQVYLEQHPELFKDAVLRSVWLRRMNCAKRVGASSSRYSLRLIWRNDDLLHKQVAQTRALKRLNFLVQLLRFSVARAY
jgi:hypothetical protein